MMGKVLISIRPTVHRRLIPCRATIDIKPSHLPTDKKLPAQESATSKPSFKPSINVIEQSKWEDGIPAIQGAHLMASGSVSPISTSKGVLKETQHCFQYFAEPYVCSLREYPGKSAISDALVEMLLSSAKEAIQKKGSFTLGIPGGSVISLLNGLVGKSAEWDKWHVFWVDERVVPLNHPESNYKAAVEAFLSQSGIPKTNQHAIVENATANETATNYEGRLVQLLSEEGIFEKSEEGFPIFDFIILGVGPDGHIASLFPNSSHMTESKSWVLPVTNSPKPPPERITLTLPVINNAKEVVVAALGGSKAEVVQRILEVQALPGSLPAQMVRPHSGNLVWILDPGSAEKLTIKDWEDKKSFPRNT